MKTVALTKHALQRAKERKIDLKYINKLMMHYYNLLKEKEIKIKINDLVVVARRDKEGTPVVITAWRE